MNDFIGGGQIFLHKIRMLGQVFFRNLHISLFLGFLVAGTVYLKDFQQIDLHAVFSYRKAVIALSFNEVMNDFRESIGKNANHNVYIDVETSKKAYKHVDALQVLKNGIFKTQDQVMLYTLKKLSVLGLLSSLATFLLIYLWWSKFGSQLKQEIKKETDNKILTAKEVASILSSINMRGQIKIGYMPLVKDMETRHFLISGATGSGKTNLFHNILPQIISLDQAAIVIDQTGEMIAKYYDKTRGDIIFNPLDSRSSVWNFWEDVDTEEDLERFSKILFGFNRKYSGYNNDPFWEQSAEVVFNACATKLMQNNNRSIEELTRLVRENSKKELRNFLLNTKASRYLDEDGKTTASSILSVLATATKPLSYLKDLNPNVGSDKFALKEYFKGIAEGKANWLFLANKPSSRELTLALSSCLLELSLGFLMDIGINSRRRLWFVIDELASLKKLPALTTLISEGRKYGACIIAGLQSLNQLYENYGHHAGSTLFGQFGTNFFFRNNEPQIAQMIIGMCGSEVIIKHNKNTSFGANEFRDGVSYSEMEQKKPLIEYSDLAKLSVGECYILLPEPTARLAKTIVPEAKIKNKNEGFIPLEKIYTSKPLSNNKIIEIDSSPNDADKVLGSAINMANYSQSSAISSELENEELVDVFDTDFDMDDGD